MGAALNFFTQYKQDGNDLLIIDDKKMDFLLGQEENQQAWFEKKEEEALSKFKNEQFARHVMLTALWDCCGLVYAELGSDAHIEKQNVTQDTYFDTSMYVRNAI